jgi:hypothetical protein
MHKDSAPSALKEHHRRTPVKKTGAAEPPTPEGKVRLEGGAADLTGRKMGGGRGTYPAAPAGGSVSDLVDKRFAGAGR